MTPLVSRLLVAAAGVPVVLGLVWLGGWWLWTLAFVIAIVGLHELYLMTRPLRPLVLAGYAGGLLLLLGAQLGGLPWMLGGFASTFALAFGLYGIAETRQPATVAVGSTLLGVGWIGLGLGHLLLLRGLVPGGRLAAFTVLLAVWAANTAAFFVGRLVGRHKMSPVLSPGKTWEGFLAGAAAAVFVTYLALYKQDFLTGWQSLVLGGVIALSAATGDLFESALKRDMHVKDSGRLLGGHGGVLDAVDALLFASVAAFYAILALGPS